MEIFYAPDIQISPFLFEEESFHCVKVLRHQIGDVITICDGNGYFYKAKILVADKHKCSIEIVETEFTVRRKHQLHIAISPTKNKERFEWFLEKATEIGIDEITPILSTRTERSKLNHERMNKILSGAMKQSQRSYLPVLNEAKKYIDFIGISTSQTTEKFICHVDANNKQTLKQKYSVGKSAFILIGPEGDFTNEEIELAIKNNFISVSLGENTLRTETAGIVACEQFSFINQ